MRSTRRFSSGRGSTWKESIRRVVVPVAGIVIIGALAFEAARPNVGGATEEAVPSAAGGLAAQLYVDPDSQPHTWARAHPDDPRAKVIENRIASRPAAKWFGEWSGDVTASVSSYTTAAEQAGKVPVLIAYYIPHRDCGSHSDGGTTHVQAYRDWIDDFATGLNDRRALVILEPDALPMLTDCLDERGQQARLDMLAYAVDTLQSDNVWVYLDAGHSNWVPAEQMAERLRAANIQKAHGFALNTSNYNPTEQEIAYAKELNSQLGMFKPFVVDTSRNGSGSNGEWCNPTGMSIGAPPQIHDEAELLLWLKVPGESDGDCGVATGTVAGQFTPRLAMQLLRGA